MMEAMKGRAIIQINAVLTVVFIVTSLVAVVVFDQPWKAIAVTVCLVCFSVGVVAFLWGYWTAVQRSREDEISVAALYFLVDGAAPSRVSRLLNGLLLVQVVVAIATAIARSSTDGKAGSTLAFGILVPMMGLGVNGLWASAHGKFSPRISPQTEAMPQESAETRQDKDHD